MGQLEDIAFSSWDSFRVHLGEPLLLTACLGESRPNGAACSAVAWAFVPAWHVRAEFKARLAFMCKNAAKLKVPWSPVRLRTGASVPQQVAGSVESIANMLLERFIEANTSYDLVGLPFVAIRSPSDVMIQQVLMPEPEMEYVLKTKKIAALRVQLPIVPAAVRTSSSMLSATVELAGQRVVVHSKSAADTTLDPVAHNAPMYIGLTRVSDAADVAITHDSIVHENMFAPRQPVANLAAEVQRLSQGQGYCNLYHAYAQGHDGQPPPDRGSAVFDARLNSQAAHGFFRWAPDVEASVVNAFLQRQAAP